MKKIAILMYHRVENLNDDYNMQAVTPINFEEQMKYLCNNFDILRFDSDYDSWSENAERDGVIITFDDGYYDYYTNALPILVKYNIPSVVFIATGNVDRDKENWTDDILRCIFSNELQKDYLDIRLPFYKGRLYTRNYQEKYNVYCFIRKVFLNASELERKQYTEELIRCTGVKVEGRSSRRIMASWEIKEISLNKNVLIGAHTENHVSLKKLNYAEQEKEITNSKRTLEKIMGRRVKFFSYPFGSINDYSSDTMDILQRNGFEKAVTTNAKCVEKDSPLELPRFFVKNYDLCDFRDFIEKQVFQYQKEDDEKTEKANIIYIGNLEQDSILQNKRPTMVIWGAGICGKRLLEELRKMGFSECIEAFGDNSNVAWGKQVCGVTVCSLEQVRELQRKEDCHILVTGHYDLEICKQLVNENIGNIHLLV